MWDVALIILRNPIVHGALAGAAAACWQDIEQWKTYGDAATFNYRVASFRWLKGGIAGTGVGVLGHVL